MVKTHPQWEKTRELVQSGELGKIKLIQGCFSYFNDDPTNIRNIAAYGGGAMWDIGCYPVMTSRFVLGEEPVRVVASMENDKSFKSDMLSSVIMEFPSAQAIFSVGTQVVKYQTMNFFGEKKRLEVRVPFNAPNDKACQLLLDEGDLFKENLEKISFDVVDQYKVQADAFTRAVVDDTEVPVTLEAAKANTKVLEAIFRSAKEMKWVEV